MKYSNPRYKLDHLMILVVILAGVFAALPAGRACYFATLSLIAILVIPTCKPDTMAEWLAFLAILAVVEFLVSLASIAIGDGDLLGALPSPWPIAVDNREFT